METGVMTSNEAIEMIRRIVEAHAAITERAIRAIIDIRKSDTTLIAGMILK